uniref:Uncharacterized protein n=1 Tax=Nelumbo nucifera TaxID=4432 RepID=A0A822YPV0_NELNU|nr:TPA_asm: hypothetical protein HUJ06_004763 [Nelumbo nucifera]
MQGTLIHLFDHLIFFYIDFFTFFAANNLYWFVFVTTKEPITYYKRENQMLLNLLSF